MNDEKTMKYHRNGAFEYEQTVTLINDSSRIMNDIVSFNRELEMFDSQEILAISDDLHTGFLALMRLRKILLPRINELREKFNPHGETL